MIFNLVSSKELRQHHTTPTHPSLLHIPIITIHQQSKVMAEETKKKILKFNDSDSESENEQSNDNNLKINKSFASEFEKRKRQQELINSKHNPQYFSDDDSSSGESEDEDAELLTTKVDLQILKTINALRNKDDSIYQKDTKFFKEVQNASSDSDGDVAKKRKPKTYKDMVREEILEKMEKGEDAGSDGDDEKVQDILRSRQQNHKMEKLEYDEEQKALRADFMKGDSDSNDEEDDWLVKKKGNNVPDGEVEKERLNQIEALAKNSESKGLKLSDPKGEVEDGEKFLLDFVKNKRWVDQHEFSDNEEDAPTKPRIIGNDDDDNDSDASLEDVERTDAFESKYNFRFEEANENSGAALSVVGYSRSSLSDTIRRKDESRKLKREQRKDRKASERKAKEERLKRLKNAKKDELEGRIKQIKSVLGEQAEGAPEEGIGDDPAIDEEMVAKLMEGDFDPDKFEELMSKMYSDDFYEKEEKEWKTDLDVKESLKNAEAEADGIVLNDEGEGGVYDDAGGEMEDDGEYDENEDYDMEEDPEHEGDGVTNAKQESGLDKKLKERMLDELYKLDYEDIIGDMPTRFKYRKVEKNRYGLRPEEILFSRDTSLKQFVSLKRMAPYIEDGEYVPGSKKRRHFRQMSKAEIESEVQQYAPKSSQKESNGTEEDQQPKKKRRRQKKGKKIDSSEVPTAEGVADEKLNTKSKDDKKSKSDKEKEPTSTKRTRKKKGAKSKKNEDETAFDTNQELSNSDIASNESPAEKKARNKDHKNTHKPKKQKVDGVSSSRLQSYGL